MPDFLYYDSLAGIDPDRSWQDNLEICRAQILRYRPGLDRISLVLYEEEGGRLRTFTAVPQSDNPLTNYDFPLEESASLLACVAARCPRLINDMDIFAEGENDHTRVIRENGYRSSFTFPIFTRDKLYGILFFNSRQSDYFQGEVLEQTDLVGHIIEQVAINYQNRLRSISAAVQSAISMVNYRDPETGNHLKRMAGFARLIARDLAAKGKHRLTDEQIDLIYQFAPMHDVGKIGIPDEILLKNAGFSTDEWELMKQHTTIGRQIIEQLIDNFHFQKLPFIDYLRDIAELHHEKLDGSGYPHGYRGGEVPLPARIIAVSDIFDALTCKRPYKAAWTNRDALEELKRMAEEGKLDADCVAALIENIDEVIAIQIFYRDE